MYMCICVYVCIYIYIYIRSLEAEGTAVLRIARLPLRAAAHANLPALGMVIQAQ